MATETLVAGPELDAEVARRVFMSPQGWIEILGPDLPPYSTDIAAAWLVVEKMRERCYVVIELHADFMFDRIGWCAYFGEKGEHVACEGVFADTTPLAICRAALTALEAD